MSKRILVHPLIRPIRVQKMENPDHPSSENAQIIFQLSEAFSSLPMVCFTGHLPAENELRVLRHLQKLVLRDDFDAELFRLREFAAGALACDNVGRLFTDASACPPA